MAGIVLQELESVQKRAARFVTGNYSYEGLDGVYWLENNGYFNTDYRIISKIITD